MKRKNNRVKGFTLIELIIVIAIIAVLAGILAPTMSTYYMKSRIKAANSNAKMVYNAAQTAVQKYISRDRTALSSEKSPFDSGLVLIFYNGTSGEMGYSNAYGNYEVFDEDAANLAYGEVINAVNTTVSNAQNISWTVCVSNYIVQGCVAADNQTTDLVGYYSANRTFASERSSKIYSNWVTGTGADSDSNSIKWVCARYSDAEA